MNTYRICFYPFFLSENSHFIVPDVTVSARNYYEGSRFLEFRDEDGHVVAAYAINTVLAFQKLTS